VSVVDVTSQLNNLNKELQSQYQPITEMYDVTALRFKLRLWKTQLKLHHLHSPHLKSLDIVHLCVFKNFPILVILLQEGFDETIPGLCD
jgi:hypothetical protein